MLKANLEHTVDFYLRKDFHNTLGEYDMEELSSIENAEKPTEETKFIRDVYKPGPRDDDDDSKSTPKEKPRGQLKIMESTERTKVSTSSERRRK